MNWIWGRYNREWRFRYLRKRDKEWGNGLYGEGRN